MQLIADIITQHTAEGAGQSHKAYTRLLEMLYSRLQQRLGPALELPDGDDAGSSSSVTSLSVEALTSGPSRTAVSMRRQADMLHYLPALRIQGVLGALSATGSGSGSGVSDNVQLLCYEPVCFAEGQGSELRIILRSNGSSQQTNSTIQADLDAGNSVNNAGHQGNSNRQSPLASAFAGGTSSELTAHDGLPFHVVGYMGGSVVVEEQGHINYQEWGLQTIRCVFQARD